MQPRKLRAGARHGWPDNAISRGIRKLINQAFSRMRRPAGISRGTPPLRLGRCLHKGGIQSDASAKLLEAT
jgi:hypothetical protein